MRYTIDPLPYPAEGVDVDTPVVVEVIGPENNRIIRDYAGREVGLAVGGKVGRAELRLLGDNELIERISPLIDAIRALDDHITAVHTVHYNDGRDPDGPDDEARIRTDMQFSGLVAHVLAAVEIYTHEG